VGRGKRIEGVGRAEYREKVRKEKFARLGGSAGSGVSVIEKKKSRPASAKRRKQS